MERGGGRGGGQGGQGYLAVSVVSVGRRQLQLQAGHLGQQLQFLGLQGRAVEQLLEGKGGGVRNQPWSGGCTQSEGGTHLLQQPLGGVQLLAVMLQVGVQVSDLLALDLHLVRQNTHLEAKRVREQRSG